MKISNQLIKNYKINALKNLKFVFQKNTFKFYSNDIFCIVI